MATLAKALFGFGLWGIAIKASLACLCIGIALLISWRKKNNVFCKQCKKRVRLSDAHCKNCGAQTTDSNTEVIIGVSGKARAISILSIAVLVSVLGLSIAAYASNHASYGTGMYTDYHQTYTQNDRIWGIECDSALTAGSFNKTINLNGDCTSDLSIDSSCAAGTLILNIKQGDRIDSVDISNTNGETRYSLADYDSSSDIQLSVEHTTAANIKFKISWE